MTLFISTKISYQQFLRLLDISPENISPGIISLTYNSTELPAQSNVVYFHPG